MLYFPLICFVNDINFVLLNNDRIEFHPVYVDYL